METPESKVHSFIVKLWLEVPNDRKRPPSWRGQVTHVPSGKRRYLQRLQDIVTFVGTYVPELNWMHGSRDRRWFRSWRRKER
ncbi:MAG TPA: hypothetical protein VFX97_10075 [Pyrinomonadaceae bacterium]|nr:hypothetical protein [Pyrinomonadaceae bacterium]